MGHGDNAICGQPYIDGIYQCPSCKLKDYKEPKVNQLYSDNYKKLQEDFHVERPDYGTSGHNYADQIAKLAQNLHTESILDYGCGKCTLGKSLPFPIANFDPFIPEFSSEPDPADIVVCTDVMEHVEEEFVTPVLQHIQSLANKFVFFQIATGPAKKTLQDGRNAHITQHPGSWWLPELCKYFEPLSYQNMGGGFIFIGGLRDDS